MKIDVQVISGKSAVDGHDGEELLRQIRINLKSHESVDLDFTGVEVFASPFFNASVALLVREFGEDHTLSQLKMSHLSLLGQSVLRNSIDNAIQTRDRTDQDRLNELMNMILEET